MKPCEKCGFESEQNKSKLGLTFCAVCFNFAPNNPEELDEFIQEKINKDSLKSFRKYANFKGNLQKKGMLKKASKGKVQSRIPFGYKLIKGNLYPAENAEELREIFEKFLNSDLSLRKLSKQHNLSVNGLKKILTNFTYLGKIKFNNQIHQGKHKPLISSTLFNHVQNKLEKLKTKTIS